MERAKREATAKWEKVRSTFKDAVDLANEQLDGSGVRLGFGELNNGHPYGAHGLPGYEVTFNNGSKIARPDMVLMIIPHDTEYEIAFDHGEGVGVEHEGGDEMHNVTAEDADRYVVRFLGYASEPRD